MSLHTLAAVAIGVPNVEETVRYYTEFGLSPLGGGRFATLDGGEQFRIAYAPTRRILELVIGADDGDDIERVHRQLSVLGIAAHRERHSVSAADPSTGVRATVRIEPRLRQADAGRVPFNEPGRVERVDTRSPAVLREHSVRPRKLGHAVLGTAHYAASREFFIRGIGFALSDEVAGHASFLRCSTDHHNLLIQHAPVSFLHHTSWQVDDIDEVGRGATNMLRDHPERHVWGLGRHHLGSNFFWYLRDPAGNFSEYYSDMDCIIDDQLWKPGVWDGAKGLYNWGPPPPPSFLEPEDLAEIMTDAHHPA